MEKPALLLDQICKKYPGGVAALDGVSLCINKGEWIAVMGPSGSGKSTLLNLAAGLDKPTSGRIEVHGTPVANLQPDESALFRRENIGLIFQQFHLIPYLTALENVMLAQYYHSMVDEKEAMESLKSVQMAERAHHLPSQLSGGEQQRACIARALVNEPGIILADEPTGNLDEANEEKVLEIFHGLHKKGKTIIVVTHDEDIGRAAERIIVLKHGKITRDEGLIKDEKKS